MKPEWSVSDDCRAKGTELYGIDTVLETDEADTALLYHTLLEHSTREAVDADGSAVGSTIGIERLTYETEGDTIGLVMAQRGDGSG